MVLYSDSVVETSVGHPHGEATFGAGGGVVRGAARGGGRGVRGVEIIDNHVTLHTL